ncbi:virion protein US2 [Saimiriine alphaherpesvirus 1]|uniref:Virion protein US2 n=1 Tax=Saimiriine herpesvirus 1 (strain MV-5-4-PSL) TaxID=10353 RepID=E2IUH4_SHV1|nr:virion protein US2 [Saimiriine alphaherpesvirus 1]ADO13832.1 virion protein US2 [Saimiriine alphaherpesvirus 1]
MSIVSITVVTLIDRNGALPRRSSDADPALWNFLVRQCRVLASEPLGTPVIVRSANLRRLSVSLMDLPRPQRPVVRTGGAAEGEDVGVFAEDEDRESVEWSDVPTGLRDLARSSDQRLFHVWIVGAADLCEPLLACLSTGARCVVIEIGGLWGEGRSWLPPAYARSGASTSWTPLPPPTGSAAESALEGCEYRYAIIPGVEARRRPASRDENDERSGGEGNAPGRSERSWVCQLLARLWAALGYVAKRPHSLPSPLQPPPPPPPPFRSCYHSCSPLRYPTYSPLAQARSADPPRICWPAAVNF